jgi:hypothetical protein
MLAALADPAGAQSTITEQEAHAIGVDPYLYFYPLLTMDLTREQWTNITDARYYPRTVPAIYPLNRDDETGKPLDGANKYTLHFDNGDTPPADTFWSITLYDSEGFQVANTLNRFSVNSLMPFKYNTDGSLDLYFQNENPGQEKEANWLPAPKDEFNLSMRLYAPRSGTVILQWNPPLVSRISGTVGAGGQ